MSLQETARDRQPRERRDERLQDHYKTLGPHLRAAMLHARATDRRDRPEPSGGDSDMD